MEGSSSILVGVKAVVTLENFHSEIETYRFVYPYKNITKEFL